MDSAKSVFHDPAPRCSSGTVWSANAAMCQCTGAGERKVINAVPTTKTTSRKWIDGPGRWTMGEITEAIATQEENRRMVQCRCGGAPVSPTLTAFASIATMPVCVYYALTKNACVVWRNFQQPSLDEDDVDLEHPLPPQSLPSPPSAPDELDREQTDPGSVVVSCSVAFPAPA